MMMPGLDTGSESSGRYEILKVVNRGGMGEIALARVKGSKGFEKLVVLKRLRADAERQDHRDMFDVEAELMSRIEHPNIVQVFDQPRINGIQYLAMAYVRGRNLDQIARRTRLQNATIPNAFVLTVIGEVLRGLAFVHRLKDNEGQALGVVHQDITPSNILVSFFGEVKITDFGIAYVTSRDGGRRAGVLKGKPRYVAPEVLAGRRVNNRADLYGVGVVLYELISGRALFARATVEETLSAVARNELPDFRVVLPAAGDGVHQILRRALVKDPQDRYRTAEEMHAELGVELSRLGGPMSAARTGYLMRRWFTGDPDVPDSDPTLDAAIAEDNVRPAVLASPPSLDQTISELDRLLGAESASADLFRLPPELHRELDGLEDMEPFAALTPIPELALSGPHAEHLLLQEMNGMVPPGRPSQSVPSLPRRWSLPPGVQPHPSLPPFPAATARASAPPALRSGAAFSAPSTPPSVPGGSWTPPPDGLSTRSNDAEDSPLSRTVANLGRRAARATTQGEYAFAPPRAKDADAATVAPNPPIISYPPEKDRSASLSSVAPSGRESIPPMLPVVEVRESRAPIGPSEATISTDPQGSASVNSASVPQAQGRFWLGVVVGAAGATLALLSVFWRRIFL